MVLINKPEDLVVHKLAKSMLKVNETFSAAKAKAN